MKKIFNDINFIDGVWFTIIIIGTILFAIVYAIKFFEVFYSGN